jgi:hypothetical protein
MTEQLTDEAKKIREVMPYDEAHSSTILNGIGNGMMLGSLPFITLETYKNIAHHDKPDAKLHKLAYIGSALATVGGAVWGYVNGKTEAEHLNEYRIAALAEVSDLRHDLKLAEKRIASWESRIGDQQKETALTTHHV